MAKLTEKCDISYIYINKTHLSNQSSLTKILSGMKRKIIQLKNFVLDKPLKLRLDLDLLRLQKIDYAIPTS